MQSAAKKSLLWHKCTSIHTGFQNFPGPAPYLPSAGVGNSLPGVSHMAANCCNLVVVCLLSDLPLSFESLVALIFTPSAFSKTPLPLELRRVLSCKSQAVFLYFALEEKGPWGPFYLLRRVLAKGRHLLQILLKAPISNLLSFG